MILISKEEYKELQERLGDRLPHVAITNRHKKGIRKRRYIEESRIVLKILREIRQGTKEVSG